MIETRMNRRREDGEIATAEASLASHCAECMGYQSALVAGCPSPACWLYPWRMGRRGEAFFPKPAEGTH